MTRTNRYATPLQARAIKEAAGYRCSTCHRRCSPIALEIDHIVPWSKGGETVDSNLHALCIPCHDAKTGYPSIPAARRREMQNARATALQIEALFADPDDLWFDQLDPT